MKVFLLFLLPTGALFVDEIDGSLMGNLPMMGDSLRSLHLPEVLVILPTDVRHLLLEDVELVPQVL